MHCLLVIPSILVCELLGGWELCALHSYLSQCPCPELNWVPLKDFEILAASTWEYDLNRKSGF